LSASSGGRRCPRADSTVPTTCSDSTVTSDTGESDHHRDHEHTCTCCAPGLRRDGALRPPSLRRPSLLYSRLSCQAGLPPVNHDASESLRSTGHLNFSIRVSTRLPYPSQPETPRVGHGHCQSTVTSHAARPDHNPSRPVPAFPGLMMGTGTPRRDCRRGPAAGHTVTVAVSPTVRVRP
jgi:hypothetical protein